jgi:hypothetical protein
VVLIRLVRVPNLDLRKSAAPGVVGPDAAEPYEDAGAALRLAVREALQASQKCRPK